MHNSHAREGNDPQFDTSRERVKRGLSADAFAHFAGQAQTGQKMPRGGNLRILDASNPVNRAERRKVDPFRKRLARGKNGRKS